MYRRLPPNSAGNSQHTPSHPPGIQGCHLTRSGWRGFANPPGQPNSLTVSSSPARGYRKDLSDRLRSSGRTRVHLVCTAGQIRYPQDTLPATPTTIAGKTMVAVILSHENKSPSSVGCPMALLVLSTCPAVWAQRCGPVCGVRRLGFQMGPWTCQPLSQPRLCCCGLQRRAPTNLGALQQYEAESVLPCLSMWTSKRVPLTG